MQQPEKYHNFTPLFTNLILTNAIWGTIRGVYVDSNPGGKEAHAPLFEKN
jgi:hypothetical protein